MAWKRQLAAFSAALGRAASRLPRTVADEARSAIDDDLRSNFDQGRDPYGRQWAPRKQEPADGHSLLYDTGDLYRSRKVKVNDDGSVDVKYTSKVAGYHQEGTTKMAQRMLVPERSQGVPKAWTRAFKASLKKALENVFADAGWSRRGG